MIAITLLRRITVRTRVALVLGTALAGAALGRVPSASPEAAGATASVASCVLERAVLPCELLAP